MKQTLFLLLLLSTTGCLSRQNPNTGTTGNNTQAPDSLTAVSAENPATGPIDPLHIATPALYRDTLFFLREPWYEDSNQVHAVYVDTNRLSTARASVLDRSIGPYEADYQELCRNKIRKNHPAGLKHFDRLGLPENWVPLYRKGTGYYLYEEPQKCYSFQQLLTDSLLYIRHTADGIHPEILRSIEKTGPGHYRLRLISIEDNPADTAAVYTLHVYLLSNPAGTAYWGSEKNLQKNQGMLYVPEQEAHRYDIVAEMNPGPLESYPFDDIDFRKLLQENGFTLPERSTTETAK